jgi:2'-5' RNA ligase
MSIRTTRDDSSGEQSPRPERWRTFVAIPLPGEIQAALAGLQRRLARHHAETIRWMEPKSIHVTLRFLGGIDPELAPDIAREIEAAATSTGRFQLRMAGTGTFPPKGRPKVVWAGIEGEVKRLERLRARVEGALARVGFEPEARPFLPHVTLGRIKQEVRPPHDWRAGQAFQKLNLAGPELEYTVDRVTLFRSHMDHAGVTYEALSESRLS